MPYCHPNCSRDPAECRIRVLNSVVTAIEWAPVYDGHGVMMNRDPNTATTEKICDTCNAHWNEVHSGGEVTIETQRDPQ